MSVQPRISEDLIAFRVAGALADELRAIAAREHNHVSAVARRLLSAALQHTWLRNRRLAVSIVLLLFVAFQGALVALAVGKV